MDDSSSFSDSKSKTSTTTKNENSYGVKGRNSKGSWGREEISTGTVCRAAEHCQQAWVGRSQPGMVLPLGTSYLFQWQPLVLQFHQRVQQHLVQKVLKISSMATNKGVVNRQVHPGCAVCGCWLLPWLDASKKINKNPPWSEELRLHWLLWEVQKSWVISFSIKRPLWEHQLSMKQQFQTHTSISTLRDRERGVQRWVHAPCKQHRLCRLLLLQASSDSVQPGQQLIPTGGRLVFLPEIKEWTGIECSPCQPQTPAGLRGVCCPWAVGGHTVPCAFPLSCTRNHSLGQQLWGWIYLEIWKLPSRDSHFHTAA